MRSRGEINTTFDYQGPQGETQSLYVRVMVENRKDASIEFLTVSTGTQSWTLHPMTVTTSGRIVSTRRYVIDMLVGKAAMEFVRELRGGPRELTVTAIQKVHGTSLGYPKSIRTRSTQIARTIDSFDACVIGDKRRGAIITD